MAEDMWASVDTGLRKNTGSGLDDWVAKARASGIGKHKALVDHLKSAEGLTHGYANSVALRTFGTDAGAIGEEALMEAMFAGPKAGLRPIHDRLTAFIQGLGGDVEFAPKKGYVSVRRAKQFGTVGPGPGGRRILSPRVEACGGPIWRSRHRKVRPHVARIFAGEL